MQTDTLSFINPATGVKFGEVKMTTPDVVKSSVDEMRRAFPVWRGKSVRERVRILRKFQQLLIDERDEISRIVNQDGGKSRQDSLIELFVTVDMLAQYRWNAPKWLKRKRVSSGLYLFKKCYVEYRPHGVVAILSPWNYPLLISLSPILAALIAGNTVVLKPSEVTPATGVLVEHLFHRIPELAPFVRVIHGDGKVGAALIQARPDFVFMTGSTGTGKKVMQAAAENLTPVSLELGGKDAMLVLEDADLNAAARWGTWGAYYNTGQACMSVERVYVVESKYDEFVRLALRYTKELKSGYSPEADSSFFMGPVTDPRQVHIIDEHLKDAVEKGARVLTGGKEQGAFYKPMVVVDVNHSMKLMREETFGPIMPIMKVQNEEEAIRLANDSEFGLAASIWSDNIERAKQVANKVEAASIIINDSIAQFAVPMLPFGGIKNSGFGRTHGRDGLLEFTRPYSYAIGSAPIQWDIATALRELGKYDLATAIMGVVYGTTLKQKWETFSQLFRKKPKVKSEGNTRQSEPVKTSE